MRKDLSGLIQTLEKSATEIALSGADDREQRLSKSFSEFEAAMFAQLDDVLPNEEQLAKGVNHIGSFAHAVRQASNAMELVKAEAPEEISDLADDWINVGVTALRTMVNGTAEVPADGENLERLERQGNLAKLMTPDGEEMLVKTDLPQDYHEFLTDPVDLLADYATHGQIFTERARMIAEDLQKSEMLPDQVVEEFPELFDLPMSKALEDENLGTGDDPDAAEDPGGDQGDDDLPQNPIEMMVRLASIMVVIGGSILQSQGQGAPPMMGDENGQRPDNTAGPTGPVGGGAPPPSHREPPPTSRRQPPDELRRQEPDFGDVTLEKILKGEVAVSDTVADALEELDRLRKASTNEGDLRKQLLGTTAELTKLKDMVKQLQAQPAPAKGVTMVVEKRDDVQPLPQSTGEVDLNKAVADIERLRETDPEAASRALLKVTHATGGRPFVSFEG